MVKSWKLSVEALGRDRLASTLDVDLPEECGAVRVRVAGREGSAPPMACRTSGKKLSFVLDNLAAGQHREYVVEVADAPSGSGAGGADCCSGPSGIVVREGVSCIEINVGGQPFAVYNYAPGGKYEVPARPYFFPVYGPGGVLMARSFPMVKGIEGETQDHPHHRGLYVAYGDVNGSDNWSEAPGHGFQTHESFEWIAGGAVWGGFCERISWRDKDRKKLVSEERTVRVWDCGSSLRVLDLTVCFTATEGPVTFGDTKEGGICSIRVPTCMDGNKGGRIENSAGGVGEGETWGRRAHWVDYSGVVEGRRVGVAILDHPLNLRHPGYWHVRDYGLFAANSFGLSHYRSSFETRGDYRLDAGETLTFRYRVIFHEGDALAAGIRNMFLDWAHPPRTSWK
ncbi:MAG: PmoA family protein [Planctomycetota bacterium]|nr:PmoA family protein [Planctomycetota bacterium]